jgi:predicted RNase H-like HicB family nuclease
MNARRYPVIIEQTDTGYSAYSPDVAGCVAAGDTEEDTRRNFQDAREQIPKPHTTVDYVEVAA